MQPFQYSPVVVPDPVVVDTVVVTVVAVTVAAVTVVAVTVVVIVTGEVVVIVSVLPPTSPTPSVSSCDWGCCLIHAPTSVSFS